MPKQVCITLILSYFVSVHSSCALEAEDVVGFPKGPVRNVEETVEMINGEKRVAGRLSFDEYGHLTEAMSVGGDLTLSGLFTWNDGETVVESIFYKNGQFHYKQVDRYDRSPILNRRYIVWSEDDMCAFFYQYTRNGYHIEQATYNEWNQLIYREEYHRNAEGNIIDQRGYRSGEKGEEMVFRIITSYFVPGKIVEQTIYDREKIVERTANQYNSAGKINQSFTQDFSGNKTTLLVFKYDDRGNEIEQLNYQNNVLVARSVFYYIDQKNRIQIEWDGEGNKIRRTEERFDDRGNILMRKSEYPTDKKTQIVSYYNTQKGLVKEEYWENDQLKYTDEKIYGVDDRLIREETRNGLEEILSLTTYQYDRYGNMTEMNTPSGSGKVWKYEYYTSSCPNWSRY